MTWKRQNFLGKDTKCTKHKIKQVFKRMDAFLNMGKCREGQECLLWENRDIEEAAARDK